MAFEAFLEAQATARPRRRRLTYTLSLAVHGAALAGALAYSFWRVDELSPPTVKVTFMNAAPPAPAPPPPPAAGGGAEVKKKVAHKPRPAPSALVQPSAVPPKREEPQPRDEPRNQHAATDDSDDDDDDRGIAGGKTGGKTGGTIGGTTGGTIGGAVGGAAPAPPGGAPKMLPPQMGALQKSAGAEPDFPSVLRRPGRAYLVMAKICVSRTGAVDSVTILKGADAQLDRNVVATVKTWRYHPLLANDTAVPFCYFGRFEFKSPD